MSSAACSRLFRRFTGETPQRFLLRLRCQAAEHLLLACASVSSTAEQLGWPDPYIFSKAFKRCTGHSPSRVLAHPAGGSVAVSRLWRR